MNSSSAQTAISVPLPIVGSSKFGRFPKISDEVTTNCFVADEALINFAGYKYILSLNGNGRGFFASHKANSMFAVSENDVYQVNSVFQKFRIGVLSSNNTDVSIDEDILNNIAFCDKQNVYIYNYVKDIFYITGLPYADGTITQSGTTITGVGTFTSDMVGGTVYYLDGSSANITAFTNATTITVDVSKTITPGQDYLIIYQLDCTPNYIFFHNGGFRFTSGLSNGNQIGQWRLSKTYTVGDYTYICFPNDAQHQGGFQTKPDLPIAGIRMPGRENQILIMGSTVTVPWTNIGAALFSYQKSSTFNIDFGTINSSTLSSLNNISAWVATNEFSGSFICYTTGQDIQKISTDGIDYLFERIKRPDKCYGYMYLQSGHLFYIVTFYDQQDNITLAFDFNTQKFYNLTDENYNYFIAKKIVFFNNKYYFISINDGNIYEISSDYNTYEYKSIGDTEVIKGIPRGRILPTYRPKDGNTNIFNDLYFITEQGLDYEYTGETNYISSISIDSGGTGYTSATVIIDGDGVGAYATATITGGVITAINLDSGGTGYTWAVVTISGDGEGAFCHADLHVGSYIPNVELSVSYDGGYTFSQWDQMSLQTLGKFRNKMYYNGLGYGNEFTLQFRFNSHFRVVYLDGEMRFY